MLIVSIIFPFVLPHFLDHVELVVMLSSLLLEFFAPLALVLLLFVYHLLRSSFFPHLFGQLGIEFGNIESFMAIGLTILLRFLQVSI